MKLLEKILVPTDFRGSAESAIKMAVSLAKIFDSEIILLHVLPGGLDPKTTLVNLEKIATKQLAILREQLNQQGVKTTEPLVATGSLFEEMIKASEIYSANLIMMGSGDKTDTDHFPLGTTTEKVMRKSNKPVWVVKQNAPVNIVRIVCPVDYSEPSRRALSNAIHLARGLDVELTVLSVIESLSDQIDGLKANLEPESEQVMSDQKAQFETFLTDFDFHGVKWVKKIHQGKPHQEILKALKKQKDTLLIMGTNGRTGFNRILMGSVTERVTRELPCSFITVKSEDLILLRLENEIRDMETHFKEGKTLLSNGLAKDAINQFELCLTINNLFVPAWLGLASAYERLKETSKAENCHARANEIREFMTNRKIEAEIRGKHWLFS